MKGYNSSWVEFVALEFVDARGLMSARREKWPKRDAVQSLENAEIGEERVEGKRLREGGGADELGDGVLIAAEDELGVANLHRRGDALC